VQQGEAMMLGRYRQQPGERRKRGIDYTDFLEESEEVTNVTAAVTPEDADSPFVISNIAIDPDGLEWAYFSEGGNAGTTYAVLFTVTTNGGQRKQDTVEFDIEEDE
jgi:hypothetical protein